MSPAHTGHRWGCSLLKWEKERLQELPGPHCARLKFTEAEGQGELGQRPCGRPKVTEVQTVVEQMCRPTQENGKGSKGHGGLAGDSS